MKIVVLSGAGISAESGVKTFRDSNGLWEDHDVMEVASLNGWHANPALVLNFYNKRRSQLKQVVPNQAHKICADLERYHEVTVVTQNVDDLHERGGSGHVIHLHGSLLKARPVDDDTLEYDWSEDINLGDTNESGIQLRPAIVWFGEAVPLIGPAMDIIKKCEILIIIGTSLQVYPAASLVGYAGRAEQIYIVDPNFVESYETRILKDKLIIIKENAVSGMKKVFDKIQNG